MEAPCITRQLSSISISTPIAPGPSHQSHDTHPWAEYSATERQPNPIAFPVFPLLPTELRLKIWNYALLTPRIIEVRASETGEGTQRRPLAPLPARSLRRVCRESRQEADKALPYSAICRFLFPNWYINVWVDVLYLDFSTCVKLTDNNLPGWEARQFVKHLALPSRLFDRHPVDYACTALLKFVSVEDVTVIMVEGPRTLGAAEIVSLKKAAENNDVAARLTSSTEVRELKERLETFQKSFKKIRGAKSVPKFMIMAMDRLDGTNLANSSICFRV